MEQNDNQAYCFPLHYAVSFTGVLINP